ncbi:MAG: SGNH/GDSL hydrolase family protein [Verrucomicrobia bacterium]|nr:SGNH/GDSL hydrolase family protein [Verrucomicrobiota bacterium]
MNANSESGASAKHPSRLKRWLQNLALAAGTFLFCALLLEVALRVVGYGNLEIYEPNPVLYWRLKPNQDCFTKIDHKPVHINAHGTRGPDFANAKPPGTLRILSLGDSRTFGWGLTDDETYSRRLERALQAHAGGNRKIEVINAGVNAWSFPQMLVYFREFGLKYQPDIVLLADANLWTQFSEKNSPEFVKQFMGRVRLKNFLRRFAAYHFFIEVQLQDFYQRHRAKFIPVDPQQDALFKEQQQSDPDALFREAIQGLCDLAQRNGVKPVLLFQPVLGDLSSTNLSRVLVVKRAVAEKSRVPLVDVTPELAPEGKALYLDADPVHLNSRGNEIISRRLVEATKDWAKP